VNIFFSFFLFVGAFFRGKFASEIFKISQTDTLLFPLHTHTREPQTRKRGRGTEFREICELKFFLCTLSHSICRSLCVI